MKSKVISIFLVVAISLVSVQVNAQQKHTLVTDVKVNINDTRVGFEKDLMIIDGRTVLPLRQFCEAIGVTDIEYNPNYRTIFVRNEQKNLFMAIDMIYYQLNGQVLELDVPPTLIENITYVPVRLVSEVFNFNVNWDEVTRTINLTKRGYKVPEKYFYKEKKKVEKPKEQKKVARKQQAKKEEKKEVKKVQKPVKQVKAQVEKPKPKPQKKVVKKKKPAKPKKIIYGGRYSEEDYYWLTKIVTVEAGGMGYAGKLAVANVVLNRVKSKYFPNTVKGVIFQKSGRAVQFPPAHKKSFRGRKASEHTKKVCLDAVSGKNNISNCLYFNHRPFKSKRKDFYKKIEGEYFYK